MDKKQELLNFLTAELFNPVLDSPYASPQLKYDFSHTLETLKSFSAEGILFYIWNTLANTESQMIWSNRLLDEGFYNYDHALSTFKQHFTYDWLSS